MSFPYKSVLVLGATSGIGLALAEKMIENGSHVIAVGRRKENLDEFVAKHGKDKTSGIQFDITDLDSIPSFVENVTKSYPKLDCVFLNSGIQRGLDFTKPESIDFKSVQLELTTNYISYIYLVAAFLPFLQKQSSPTSLIFTTSGLALVPMVRAPNYCASKAALHHLILALREQLSGSNVAVIEILPPAVQTELHDEKHQPDIKNGRSIGMPLDQFTEETWAGLCERKTDIPIGMAKKSYESWEMTRQEEFKQLAKMFKGSK